jgi:chitosanase
MCFGDDAVSAINGHSDHDVLFIAFPGDAAVPGAKGAAWAAKTKEEFEASLATIGDQLVASL